MGFKSTTCKMFISSYISWVYLILPHLTLLYVKGGEREREGGGYEVTSPRGIILMVVLLKPIRIWGIWGYLKPITGMP
jgi:hypothetical protein